MLPATPYRKAMHSRELRRVTKTFMMGNGEVLPRLVTLYLDNGVVMSVLALLEPSNGRASANGVLECRSLDGAPLLVDWNRISAVALSIDPHDEFGFHSSTRAVVTTVGGHRFEGNIFSDATVEGPLRLGHGWMAGRVDDHMVWTRRDRTVTVES